MAKVYLVTDGDYSDYRVQGAFTTREQAERAIEVWNSGDVEEWELDDVPQTPPGLLGWQVWMDRNGGVFRASRSGATLADAQHDEWKYSRPAIQRDDRSEEYVGFSMWARDREHAIKIASERLTQLLADGLWGTRYIAGVLYDETWRIIGPITPPADSPV